jgi:site-specific DNA recombinase
MKIKGAEMADIDNKTETAAELKQDQKKKIRERYKGISEDQLDVIPALPQEDFYKTNAMKRVAVYARVSTDDPRQTSSYELQKNHYQDVVSRRPNWSLVEIYADEGISGTSLQHRDAFMRMIDDCNKGKIDLIITKSVSRFARNIIDCISYVRLLKAKTPPIAVFFETENIYTLNENSEMSLSFIATLAQEESHTKSEIMNASIEMRFRRGIFLTPSLLGYDKDEDGNLVINEEEAKIVRLIFFMYLYGYSAVEIANKLTEWSTPTKTGKSEWSPNTVLQVLQNERHCGDVLARKTWTPNYLDHKPKKNNKDRNQYRQRNHHEAIISRDDFIAVQRLIANARYGNKEILPQLHVINEGVLSGFVIVNPRWGSFSAEDYQEACSSVPIDTSQSATDFLKVEAQSGDFDMRGYEVARSQFFDIKNRLALNMSIATYGFSALAVRKFNKCQYIEILIHPQKMLLAARPCSTDNRNRIQWAKSKGGILFPREMSGTAFLPTLYKLFGWNEICRYRLIGLPRDQKNDHILLFNIKEAEAIIPSSAVLEKVKIKPINVTKKRKNVTAYPASWADGFGSNYYIQAHESKEMAPTKDWNVTAEASPYKESDLKITPHDEIAREINNLVKNIRQENSKHEHKQ